jgi:hypothetical protein
LPIEYLSIEGIDNLDISVIGRYKNLKTLSLDLEEAENFTEEMKAIQENNKKIIFNDIYNNQGEEYDYSI